MNKKTSGIKIGIYKIPNADGTQQPCARLISSGTKKMDEICKFISESSSVNSSDIKGVLEALVTFMGRELSYGYCIELDGLGYFSPAIENQKTIDEKGVTHYMASVGSINFRCSKRLKEMIRGKHPEKVKRENIPHDNQENRRLKMIKYLQTHPHINLTAYATLNQCTRYCAEKDFKLFTDSGLIKSTGIRTHRVYMLTEEKENKDLS